MNVERQRQEDPIVTLTRMRNRVAHGSIITLETLDESELAAAHQLILEGEAEIISSACRPYLAATKKD